jgi:hypothetical protein
MIENDSKTHTNSEEHCLRTKKASLSSSSSRKRFRASIGEKEIGKRKFHLGKIKIKLFMDSSTWELKKTLTGHSNWVNK